MDVVKHIGFVKTRERGYKQRRGKVRSLHLMPSSNNGANSVLRLSVDPPGTDLHLKRDDVIELAARLLDWANDTREREQ